MINFDNIENSLLHEITDDNGDGSCDLTNTALLELITRLRQAEKDAARYRWLKNQPWFECEAEWCMPVNMNAVGYDFFASIDVVIDEAMQCK